jgi:hypothetical protein
LLLYRGGRWLVMRPNAKEAFEMPHLPIQGAQMLKTAVELVQQGVVLAEMLPEATVLGRSVCGAAPKFGASRAAAQRVAAPDVPRRGHPVD